MSIPGDLVLELPKVVMETLKAHGFRVKRIEHQFDLTWEDDPPYNVLEVEYEAGMPVSPVDDLVQRGGVDAEQWQPPGVNWEPDHK